MTRNIFIFLILLVLFLTIESKLGFSSESGDFSGSVKIVYFSSNDTTETIFSDDFEKGALYEWKQLNDWEVSSEGKISGQYSLKHQQKETSGESSIFHSASVDLNSSDVVWKFNLKNGKWDPSSSNKFWFYLSADTIVPGLVNGYAIGVNISGTSDLLALWRIKAGKADSLIVQSDFDWNPTTIATVIVKRDTKGNWQVQYELSGELISPPFTGKDHKTFVFKNIGTYFKYTSTRSGQLWVDNISVQKLLPELLIQSVNQVSNHTVHLACNLPVDQSSVLVKNFILTDEDGNEIRILSAKLIDGNQKKIEIQFESTKGIYYSLNISGLRDLQGRPITPVTFSFSWSANPLPGSVLLNEILFNPFSGGTDFVELVNISDDPVAVHRLKLATRNDTMALKQICNLSTIKRYLKPGEFLVCTKDSSILASQYFMTNPESFCIMKSFPSFPDDAGIVVLLNDSLEILDEFSYSAKMHSSFLADEEGVSLERISLEKPTADRSNWASAAASVGFATPGLTNSQAVSETEIQDEITPEPKAFSPNGDGYNDELNIQFKFSKPGYVANVRIFDVAGRQVKFLIKNQSLAQDGSWLWDGKNDNGQLLKFGVYIILAEVFDEEGHTKAFKKTCTITDRLE